MYHHDTYVKHFFAQTMKFYLWENAAMKILSIPLVCLILMPGVSSAAPIRLDGATVSVYFSPRGGAAQAIVRLIDDAQHRVLLAGYSFTSPIIASALKRAHARGVNIQVVLDRINATSHYSGATYLNNSGIDVRINSRYQIMHHKFIIVDDIVGFGSMNFTKNGDLRNAENFNIFQGSLLLNHKYEIEFNRLYKESVKFK